MTKFERQLDHVYLQMARAMGAHQLGDLGAWERAYRLTMAAQALLYRPSKKRDKQ
jgi:hypothetical protein